MKPYELGVMLALREVFEKSATVAVATRLGQQAVRGVAPRVTRSGVARVDPALYNLTPQQTAAQMQQAVRQAISGMRPPPPPPQRHWGRRILLPIGAAGAIGGGGYAFAGR